MQLKFKKTSQEGFLQYQNVNYFTKHMEMISKRMQWPTGEEILNCNSKVRRSDMLVIYSVFVMLKSCWVFPLDRSMAVTTCKFVKSTLE